MSRVTSLIRFGSVRIVDRRGRETLDPSAGLPLLPPAVIPRLLRQQPPLVLVGELGKKGE